MSRTEAVNQSEKLLAAISTGFFISEKFSQTTILRMIDKSQASFLQSSEIVHHHIQPFLEMKVIFVPRRFIETLIETWKIGKEMMRPRTVQEINTGKVDPCFR